MHAIPAQRLLTHEVNQAGVGFFLGEERQAVPSILIFSPAWSLPLVAAYAKAMAMQALGERAHEIVAEARVESARAPLGFESHLGPIDGSPEGLLRAAFLTRAAQEALGYVLGRSNQPKVDWLAVVERATAQRESLAYRLLHANSPQELLEVARENASLTAAEVSLGTMDEQMRALAR